jgi:hypothetical protein
MNRHHLSPTCPGIAPRAELLPPEAMKQSQFLSEETLVQRAIISRNSSMLSKGKCAGLCSPIPTAPSSFWNP